MSAQKWLPDLARARKKAHGPKKTHRDELSLWEKNEREEEAAFVDGVPVVTISGLDSTGRTDVTAALHRIIDAVPTRLLVRDDDCATSVEAALSVKASQSFLLQCIRGEVERADEPLDAFQISREVLKHHPTKWELDTIRTAVSRARQAGLIRVADELGSWGSGKKKRRVRRYVIGGDA